MISSLNRHPQLKNKNNYSPETSHQTKNLHNITAGFTTAKLTIRHGDTLKNTNKTNNLQKNQIDQIQVENALMQAEKLLNSSMLLQAVDLLKRTKELYYSNVGSASVNNQKNSNFNFKNKNLFITFSVNLAIALYQVGFLQQANEQLHNAITTIWQIVNSSKLANKLKVHQRIHYEVLSGKIELQTCILYSQMGKHDMALQHARIACRIYYDLIYETLIGLYLKLNSQLAQDKDFIKNPQSEIKIQEHAALLNNISILTHLIKVTKDLKANFFSKQKAFMLSDEAQYAKKFGRISSRINIEALYSIDKILEEKDGQIDFLHHIPHAWIYKSKILDQVQLKPLPIRYLDSIRFSITNSDVIERIVFLTISLYCFSTQTRFVEKNIVSDPTDVLDSEHWLSRSLQIAYMFMPPESPILNQILTVHDRFHGIDKQTIPQDKQVSGFFKVLRPLTKPKSTYNSKSAMCSPILIRIQAQKLTIDLDVSSTHREQSKQSSHSKKFIQNGESTTLNLDAMTKNNKIRGFNTVDSGKQRIMNFMDFNSESITVGKKLSRKGDTLTVKPSSNGSPIISARGLKGSIQTTNHLKNASDIQNGSLKPNFNDLNLKQKKFEDTLRRPHSQDRQIIRIQQVRDKNNSNTSYIGNTVPLQINNQRKKKSFSTKKRQVRSRTSSSSHNNGESILKLDGFQLMPSTKKLEDNLHDHVETFDLFTRLQEGKVTETKINGNVFINNNINLFISKGGQTLEDITHKKHNHTSYYQLSRRQNIANKRKSKQPAFGLH